jgi:hypothetical protein
VPQTKFLSGKKEIYLYKLPVQVASLIPPLWRGTL